MKCFPANVPTIKRPLSTRPGTNMASQHYCLRWNNYQSNMTSVFHQLLQDEAFVDVTLACNEASLKAHKVVLSACSPFFQKLLLENPCKHPVIIMPQDVCYSDLKFIIEFVYKGEIDVSQAELQSLLKTADQLKIKGLCEVSDKNAGGSDGVTSLPISRRSFTKLRLSGYKRRCVDQVKARRAIFPDHHRHHHQGGMGMGMRRRSLDTERGHGTLPPPGAPPGPVSGDYGKTGDPQSQPQQHGAVGVPSNGTRGATGGAEGAPCCPEGAQGENKGAAATSVPEGGEGGSEGVTGGVGGEGGERHPVEKQEPGVVVKEGHEMVGSGERQPPPPPSQPQQGGRMEELEIYPCSPADRMQGPRPEHPNYPRRHSDEVKVKLELRAIEPDAVIDIDSHMSERNVDDEHTMMITPELLGLIPSSSGHSDGSEVSGTPGGGAASGGGSNNSTIGGGGVGGGGGGGGGGGVVIKGGPGGPKNWNHEDMEMALDALRTHAMSLTRASATFGIPSTTLWQRAHRLGIDTPKKDGGGPPGGKSWSEDDLTTALDELRAGRISANRAAKVYRIPSSTLYKIARKEGIKLSAPFNATPTTWSSEDLNRALEAIRQGVSVQRASSEHGIPSGTLYGRCKREGIELSKSNPVPWSEDDMNEALEAVRVGEMSINQAAIHYNLPYSSLYGRFKRIRFEAEGGGVESGSTQGPQGPGSGSGIMLTPSGGGHEGIDFEMYSS